MANPLTQAKTLHRTVPDQDHRSLLEAASRCYSDAVRRDNPGLLEKSALLAYQAWQINETYIPGINLLARIATHRQRYDEAGHWIDTGLSLKPESTSLLYSAGHLALANQDLSLAERYFEKASQISRVNTKAPVYLAHVKLLKGDYLGAFQLYRELAKTKANDPQIRSKLFEAAFNVSADFYSAELEAELIRWFSFENVDYSLLRPLATSLLKHKLRLSESGCPLDADEIATDPLLQTCLSRFVFCDPVIERLLMTLRQSILLTSSRQMSIRSEYLPLVIGLSHQCELNESVWYISAQENALVMQLNDLASKILALPETKSGDVSGLLLLIMMYHPLCNSGLMPALASRNWLWPDEMSALMDYALSDQLTVSSLRQDIPSLGGHGNKTSEKVRAQYEENPYPRWSALGYNQPADYISTLKNLFRGQLDELERPSRRLNVLVAGCGTGRHAISLAHYFTPLDITAMDLSTASLAYARMKATQYGLSLNFIQGDLLQSERLDGPFDVIECSGVLHHMQSPQQGLNALTRSLKPGGLMKIALYSRQARTLISELREELGGDLPHTAEEIRAAREALLSQGGERWQAILQSPDFYSLSACRDLLFHEQEHVFDLQEIRRLVENAGLDWVGILPPAGARELAEEKLQLGTHDLTLNDWHTLEQLKPSLFSGMYQFYVRKPLLRKG